MHASSSNEVVKHTAKQSETQSKEARALKALKMVGKCLRQCLMHLIKIHLNQNTIIDHDEELDGEFSTSTSLWLVVKSYLLLLIASINLSRPSQGKRFAASFLDRM